MINSPKTIPMIIYSLHKMHFKVDVSQDGYSVLNSDGCTVFGDNCKVTEMALRQFEECAYSYRRRNGLRKLKKQVPEIVMQIKNNRWLWND